ncbi:hypothetical protein FBEOM_13729 [Fusarium beomiforme]|uniref:Uncharacterized protein n=1 Tax=Fusarium beomiforme TaxID=44412 RepID=A0A9P5A687_9HYPO|nr:hypothetical protein FBEOM_13729 [Fusarium beomiforme]
MLPMTSTRSGSSSIESTTESETSSFTISSAYSTTFASTTTEAVTSGDTTTQEISVSESTSASEATATKTTSTEATSTEATSIETIAPSVITSASSEITEAPTTTEPTTTAAASTTALPKFRLVAQGGPSNNMPLKASYQSRSTLLFTESSVGYTEASFTVNPVNGQLSLDNGQTICASTAYGTLEVCPSTLSPTESVVTCETPLGQQLQCSVPQTSCTYGAATGTVCTPTGVNFDTMYTGTIASGVYNLELGPAGGKSGSVATSLILQYDP